jgi:hypothetical protein
MTGKTTAVSPPFGPRRGLRAEVGQLSHPLREVAPLGTVGEPTAKPGDGQDASGPIVWPGASGKDANGNYGLVYHLARRCSGNSAASSVQASVLDGYPFAFLVPSRKWLFTFAAVTPKKLVGRLGILLTVEGNGHRESAANRLGRKAAHVDLPIRDDLGDAITFSRFVGSFDLQCG